MRVSFADLGKWESVVLAAREVAEGKHERIDGYGFAVYVVEDDVVGIVLKLNRKRGSGNAIDRAARPDP